MKRYGQVKQDDLLLWQSKTDGAGDMKALLGGKRCELGSHDQNRLAVPPGFTITTEVLRSLLQE